MRSNLHGGVGVLLWELVAATVSANDECVDYRGFVHRVASLPANDLQDVEVSGDMIYVADLDELLVIDISDPSNPIERGRVDIAMWPGGIAVSGSHVYVGGSSLQVVDVSSPGAPFVHGELATTWYSGHVIAHGSYLYARDSAHPPHGLKILDISVPTAPVLIDSVDTGGLATGIGLFNDHLYIAGPNGLRVLELSTPSAPTIVGELSGPTEGFRMDAEGDYLYVANWSQGFDVIDIHDPTSPAIVANIPAWDFAAGVAVHDGFAYLAGTLQGLMMVDVSEPSAPVLVREFANSSTCWDVAIAGGHAYTVSHWTYLDPFDDDIHVFDIGSNAAAPVLGELTLDVKGMFAGESFLYVVNDQGLHVADMTTPSAPVVVGSVALPAGAGAAGDVVVAGSYAYTAHGNLRVVDITDPTAPVVVGSASAVGAAEVAWLGERLAVAGLDRLRVFDVGDPTLPVEVGSLATAQETRSIFASGDYIYLSDEDGLRVVDAADPTTPVVVGEIDVPSGRVFDSAVVDGYVLLANEDLGIQVVDVSDPSTPTIVTRFDTPGEALSLDAREDRLYIADRQGGVRVVDVSQPENPRPIGESGVRDMFVERIAASDSWVCTSDSEGSKINVFPAHCDNPTPTLPGASLPPMVAPARPLAARPNPFSATTRLSFLQTVGGSTVLEVFDVGGRLVGTRNLGRFEAGANMVEIDGREFTASSGVWFARLRTPGGMTDVVRLVRVD
jgi:hypothetical protein